MEKSVLCVDIVCNGLYVCISIYSRIIINKYKFKLFRLYIHIIINIYIIIQYAHDELIYDR